MPWVAPEDFFVGQVLTAASMDDISGNLSYLKDRSPAARWHRTSNQSIAHATATTVIFPTVQHEHNPDADWTMDTASGVLTVNTTGRYRFQGGVAWQSNTTGNRVAKILVNGTKEIVSDYANPPGGVGLSSAFGTIWQATAADTVRMEVSQSSGGALSLVGTADFNSVFFAVEKISH